MFSIKTFCILASVFATGTLGFAQNLTVSNSTMAAYLKLTTTLKLKDSCSWSDEVVRNNWIQKINKNGGLSMGSKEFKNEVSIFIDDVVANNKTFCSGAELVVCDEKSEMCKCGDPGKRATLPDSIDAFVEERDENGDLRCRWDEGSYCASEDILKKLGTFVNSKCRRGTQCTSKSDGTDCSFSTILDYIVSNLDKSRVEITKDLFNGKICTCEPEEATNKIIPDADVSARRERDLKTYALQNIETIQSTGLSFGILNSLDKN